VLVEQRGRDKLGPPSVWWPPRRWISWKRWRIDSSRSQEEKHSVHIRFKTKRILIVRSSKRIFKFLSRYWWLRYIRFSTNWSSFFVVFTGTFLMVDFNKLGNENSFTQPKVSKLFRKDEFFYEGLKILKVLKTTKTSGIVFFLGFTFTLIFIWIVIVFLIQRY